MIKKFMETQVMFWLIIVGFTVVAIIGYFIYSIDKHRGHNFHYIGMDHDEIYCDEEDCDE
jgi:uncharacterized protein YqhQ